LLGSRPDWKAEIPRDRGSSLDFEDVRDFYVREVFGGNPLAVRRVDPERYLELGRLAIAQAMLQCFVFWRQNQFEMLRRASVGRE
jgi:beta-mannosidase